jgi:hypothetical protein
LNEPRIAVQHFMRKFMDERRESGKTKKIGNKESRLTASLGVKHSTA